MFRFTKDAHINFDGGSCRADVSVLDGGGGGKGKYDLQTVYEGQKEH